MIETKFKNSEVGLIPEDWKAVPLSAIGEVKMCKRILKEQTDITGDVPFYKIGTFGKEADAYIPRELYEQFKGMYPYPKKGAILISAAGTIGRTVVFDGEDAYFQDSNIVWIDHKEKDVVNPYLEHYFKIISWKSENGGTISRLYNDNLKSTFLCYPEDKIEQSRIATALSDIDDLIATAKKLTEKKRNIKEGAMQELLSGKRRLPGFKEKWEETNVGSVTGKISRGQTLTSDEFCFGIIPVMAGGKQYAGYHNKANQKGRCITISGSGASAGFVYLHKTPIFATDCSVIAESNSFSLNFMYYLLSFKQDDLYKLQTGGAQPHVYPRDIEAIEIIVPSTKREQQAIAQVLSDMDSEIQSLESQLTKYQSLKQGMMQQLLTGKIRLI